MLGSPCEGSPRFIPAMVFCWLSAAIVAMAFCCCRRVSGSHMGECCLCCIRRQFIVSLFDESSNTYVFEAIQVLVAFATDVTLEGFLFLHAKGAGIGCRGLGVDNGERAIAVLVQLLACVTMSLVVPESKLLARFQDSAIQVKRTSDHSGSCRPSRIQ